MDITYYGQMFFKIKGKKISVSIDPNKDAKIKSSKSEADIILKTGNDDILNETGISSEGPFIISGPGEYEVKEINIYGIKTSNQTETSSKNTAYQIKIDGINIFHAGLITDVLPQRLLEELDDTHILILPIGQGIVSSQKASELIAQLEPLIVIPGNFPQTPTETDFPELAEFKKEIGKEITTLDKLTITKDKLPEEVQIICLEVKNG